MNNSFTDATDRKSTMGLDHYGKVFTVDDKSIKLQLWDTGGKICVLECYATMLALPFKYIKASFYYDTICM